MKKIVLIAGVLIAIAFLFFLTNTLMNNVLLTSNPDLLDNSIETKSLLEQRESYNISPVIFSDLPEPPNDFVKIVSLYHEGDFKDELFFSEKYFLQPEFYPSFVTNGLPYWLNPSTTHYGVYGYGSYPTKKTFFIKQGEEIKTKFFFHSGYGVRSYQGIKLGVVFDNAENKDFFDVEIKEPVFLLEPNFPKFEKNWAHDILLNIFVKENTPDGTYTLKIIVSPPPENVSNEWRTSVSGKYFDAGFVSIDQPVFKINLIVN